MWKEKASAFLEHLGKWSEEAAWVGRRGWIKNGLMAVGFRQWGVTETIE